MIVINFKKYVRGKKSLMLAQKIEKHLPKAIVCPAFFDLGLIRKETKLNVFSQYVSSGKLNLVDGSLLNHSDHRVKEVEIKKTIGLMKEKGLRVILCVKNVAEAREFKKFEPWAIAFEDEELIGTKNSIVSYRQEEVKEFVKVLDGSRVNAFCGAGINSVEDVKAAREFGCKGVLIASAVAKVENPDGLLKAISKIQ